MANAVRGANRTGSVWLVKRKTLPDYYRGAVTLRDGSKKYVSHASKEACQALVDDLVERVKNREPIRSNAAGTVKTEADRWLVRRSQSQMGNKPKLTESSVRTYRVAIDRIIDRTDGMDYRLGRMRVTEVTAYDVGTWLDNAFHVGLSGAYIRQAYSALTQTFQMLVKEGVVALNPCAAVDRPERKKVNSRGIEGGKLNDLLFAARQDRLSLRWMLSLALGVRPAEVLAIRMEDFVLNGPAADGKRSGILTICGQIDTRGVYIDHTKGKEPRFLPLDEDFVELFAQQLARRAKEQAALLADGRVWPVFVQDGRQHDFLFRDEDGAHMTVSKDTRRWNAVVEQAALPPMVRYVSRHTAASHMIGKGIDPVTAAKLLGHKNPWMTLNVYGHALVEETQAAVATMSGVMNSASRRGYEAAISDGDTRSQLEDLRERLVDLDLDTTEIDSKIEAAKEKAAGSRQRRSTHTP